jgi:hypothetical protein
MAAIALDPESYGLLKEIIDETYTDGVDSIREAWVYPDRSIQAFVTDEGRELSVEIGEDINIFQTGEDASFQASFGGGKPRNCVKGISCGGSCIAKNKTCRKKSSESQKAKAKEIVNSALTHVPRKEEPKAKGKRKQPAAAKGKTGKGASSDATKASVSSQREENISPRDAASPKHKAMIEDHKKYNNMIRSLGEVGDPSKMSADDLTTVLTKTEGEHRQALLGVTRKHYNNEALAKEWYRGAVRKVHPDINKSAGASNAFQELDAMYKNMTS